MKLTQAQKNIIISSLKTIEGKDEFLNLLNYAKGLLYPGKAIPYKIRQLNYCILNDKIHSDNSVKPEAAEMERFNLPMHVPISGAPKSIYKTFTIKKKSGKDRIIHAPEKGLKSLQKSLNLILQTVYESYQHKNAFGFVNDKSIVDNARIHVGQNYVYNLDLKDFFPTIEAGRIFNRLKYPPFSLADKKNIANIITWLTTTKMEVERWDQSKIEWVKTVRNVLPQGSPTSPTLSNIVCHNLDYCLTSVAHRFGLKYSRYADDITFSSSHNVYQKDGEFLKEVNKIIKKEKFHIKESKTRLQKKGNRQQVTGLVVNEKENVHKRYIKQLRMWLYYWEKYGHEKAENLFYQNYIKNDLNNKIKGQKMCNVISGKLKYLKMIKGDKNTMYLKLAKRFEQLISNQTPVIEREFYLARVLDNFFENGFDRSMELYKTASNGL